MILDIEDLLLTCFTLLFQKIQYLTMKDNSTPLLKRNDSGFHLVKLEMGGQQTSWKDNGLRKICQNTGFLWPVF